MDDVKGGSGHRPRADRIQATGTAPGDDTPWELPPETLTPAQQAAKLCAESAATCVQINDLDAPGDVKAAAIAMRDDGLARKKIQINAMKSAILANFSGNREAFAVLFPWVDLSDSLYVDHLNSILVAAFNTGVDAAREHEGTDEEVLAAYLSSRAKHAADARHSKPGGSRDKRKQMIDIWATGKYTTRDRCAEEECAALGIPYSKARKYLIGTPDNATTKWKKKPTHC